MIVTLKHPVLRQLFIAAALLSSLQTSYAGSDEPAPVPKLSNGSLSADGHARITWDVPYSLIVELQQAENKFFEGAKTVYQGPDRATYISGLENGTYYYRLRAKDGAWSDPVILTVKHHSLRLALILCSVGAVVFALTVFIVVKGALNASTD